MEGLSDLINQYDWREAISIGLGITAGVAHAIYDHIKGNQLEILSDDHIVGGSSRPVFLGIVCATSAYNIQNGKGALTPLRSTENGLLGGAAYALSYFGVRQLLEKFKTREEARSA